MVLRRINGLFPAVATSKFNSSPNKEKSMKKRINQHIGDDQRVYGMPKHMVGVSISESLKKMEARQSGNYGGTASDSQRSYWTVHPKPKACDKCKAMEGLRYLEEPQRPHPNCKCEIRQHSMPVVSKTGTLQGHGSRATEKFEAGQKITMEIKNLGPFGAGARIHVDGSVWEATGMLAPGMSKSFEFTKFGEIPMTWEVTLSYDGGDNSTMQYFIRE